MKFLYLEETNSTNNYSKSNFDKIEDKTIVYTSKQTNGRGRFDRTWVNLGNENLFLSIILKPSDKLLPVYSNLTQYTATSLSKTFATYNINPQIKWPNDILINEKKISGILAETVFRNNTLKGLIIGVGINLNAKKEDFKQIDKAVTALNLETNTKINKLNFLNKFSNEFFENYDKFLKQGFPMIKNYYEKHANFLNKIITIKNITEEVTGKAEKLNDNGAIIINGKAFLTGDII